MCKHNSFGYINNGNISNIHLFDNGLHLLEPGMCVLANNFIFRLNYFFTDACTLSERTILSNGIVTLSERTILNNGIVTHKNSVSNQSSDPQVLGKNRLKYPNNLLIGYLNINSLRNKIIDVREVIEKLSLDYFVISEIKLDKSFPSAHFNVSNYEIRNRRERDKNGGGIIEFVRKGLITKRLKDYETQICETFTLSIQHLRKNGFALVCTGHPLTIISLFSLKN